MIRVLVVDDDTGMRDVLKRMLEGEGLQVALAANGKTGLAAFRAAPPDLAVVDIIMPEKEGLETIATMRREHPETRIIAISGGGRAHFMDFLQIARKLGADATLEKPFRKSEILDLVAHLLRTRP